MEKLAVLKRNAWPGNRLRLGADFWARVSWPMIKSSAGPADLMVKPRWNLVFREKKENAEISLVVFRWLLFHAQVHKNKRTEMAHILFQSFYCWKRKLMRVINGCRMLDCRYCSAISWTKMFATRSRKKSFLKNKYFYRFVSLLTHFPPTSGPAGPTICWHPQTHTHEHQSGHNLTHIPELCKLGSLFAFFPFSPVSQPPEYDLTPSAAVEPRTNRPSQSFVLLTWYLLGYDPLSLHCSWCSLGTQPGCHGWCCGGNVLGRVHPPPSTTTSWDVGGCVDCYSRLEQARRSSGNCGLFELGKYFCEKEYFFKSLTSFLTTIFISNYGCLEN